MAKSLRESLEESFDAPRAYDLLAITQAAGGDFVAAVEASDQAISAAKSNEQFHLARQFEEHRQLFINQQRLPFGSR